MPLGTMRFINLPFISFHFNILMETVCITVEHVCILSPRVCLYCELPVL